MNRFSKILLAILAILLFVVLAELGYFFFFKAQPNQSGIANQPQNSVPLTTSSPSPKQNTALSTTGAINRTNFRSLSRIKKGILTSSLLANSYRGTIVALNTQGGTMTGSSYQYKMSLKLTSKDQLSNTFYFSQDDVKKFALDLSGFKVGDKVNISEIVDLTKDIRNNLILVKISKL